MLTTEQLLSFYIRPWPGGGVVVLSPQLLDGGELVESFLYWFRDSELARVALEKAMVAADQWDQNTPSEF